MKLRYFTNIVTLAMADEGCLGCGRCLEVCPHQVFILTGGKAVISDRGGCMECGACARNCPAQVITVRPGVGCAWAIMNSKGDGEQPCCGGGKAGCC